MSNNLATTLAGSSIIVPSTGFQVIGGPLSVPFITGQTYDLLEFSASSNQPSVTNGNQQEFFWNTTPVSQSGATWYAPNLWTTTASGTSGVGSSFTPKVAGLYTVFWAHFWTSGTGEIFVLKNVVAGGSTFDTNNMKALTSNSTTIARGQTCCAQIQISSATDSIGFGWYNGTGNTTTIPMATERVYLRILRQ